MEAWSSGTAVRIEDAGLVAAGGPVRLVLSRPGADVVRLLDADPRVQVSTSDGRVAVLAAPRVLDALLRDTPGAPTAVADAVVAALAGWSRPPTDLATPAGVLPTSQRPVVMAVLNVTPDSFSDGGHYFDAGSHPGAALAAGARLLEEGADLVDVGGESSRPGATPVDLDEELARVLPVVEGLAAAGAVVSVDTTKATVARRAVEAGAAVVNDVSAGCLDDAMWPAVAELGVPYVLMHMQGTPRTMQRDPVYGDVVAEVFEALHRGLGGLAEAGVPPERVVVDPGLGFGKTDAHNLALVRHLRTFTSLGRPVMVGGSRKRLIGRLTDVADPTDRLEGSLALAALAVAGGARLVRVHDVRATRRAVQVARAVTGSWPAPVAVWSVPAEED